MENIINKGWDHKNNQSLGYTLELENKTLVSYLDLPLYLKDKYNININLDTIIYLWNSFEFDSITPTKHHKTINDNIVYIPFFRIDCLDRRFKKIKNTDLTKIDKNDIIKNNFGIYKLLNKESYII